MNFRSILLFILISSPLCIFAFGVKEINEKMFLKDATKYLSPNEDAANHILTLKDLVIDLQGKKVKTYKLNVYNKDGHKIYTGSTNANSDSSIPDSFSWNLTLQNGGKVKEGEYSYQIITVPAKGAPSISPAYILIVDSTPPDINLLKIDRKIITPNGDSKNDYVTFSQITGIAYKWTYSILDENGTIVWQKNKTSSLEGLTDGVAADPEVVWDGSMDSGVKVNTGSYIYRLTGVDRAGNETYKDIGIKVSDSDSAIRIISPNGKNSLNPEKISPFEFKVEVDAIDEIKSWQYEIEQINKDGRVSVSKMSGTKDDMIKTLQMDPSLQDGEYDIIFQILYESGKSEFGNLKIRIDRKPPELTLSANTMQESTVSGERLVFGGVLKKYLNLEMSSVEDSELYWTIVLSKVSDLFTSIANINSENKSDSKATDGGVYQKKMEFSKVDMEKAGFTFPIKWIGENFLDRTLLDSGEYEIYLKGEDEAGNSSVSNIINFSYDRRDRGGDALVVEPEYYEEGGSDKNIKITPKLLVNDMILSYDWKIFDKNINSIIFEKEIKENSVKEFLWDATKSDGSKIDEGLYRVILTVKYLNGDVYSTQSRNDLVYTNQNTEAKVNVLLDSYTPNGDGVDDFVEIEQEVKSKTQNYWKGKVLNSKGKVVKEFDFGYFVPAKIRWDGLDNSKNPVEDDNYTYLLTTSGRFNKELEAKDSFYIENNGAILYTEVQYPLISPNKDKYRDSTEIKVGVKNKEELSEWTLTLMGDNGRIKTYKGDGNNLDTTLIFDGLDDSDILEEGKYDLILNATFSSGVILSRKTGTINVILNSPKNRVSVKPLIFSPDGDGKDDSATIFLEAASERPIKEWKVSILDPYKNVFRSYKGSAQVPDSINWDGRSDKGELSQSAVDYVISFEVKDNAGNSSISETHVVTDIILIKENDKRFRILIPSIQFAPNISDLFNFTSKSVFDSNITILRRLAKVLEHYQNGCNITIEGHATYERPNVSDKDMLKEQNEELLPLSQSRAREVKKALAILGLKLDSMQAVGIGGARPIVPHDDNANKWKNRRVEFIIEKK